jgi:hypothetical protein
MKYDIYFHNDFDGRASAAVMLAFLHSRGDDIERYTAMTYGTESAWYKLGFFDKGNPAIVVDFTYHPRAAWWFDHHASTFKKLEWKKHFKSDKHHRLEPQYKSCCGLVYAALTRDFNWNPPKHLAKFVAWADKIDGAGYSSAKETLAMRDPAILMNSYIEALSHTAKEDAHMIKLMAEKPLGEVIKDPKIAKAITHLKMNVKRSLAFYERNLEVFTRSTFVDVTKDPLHGLLRYAPYYIYPKIVYSARMKNKGKLWYLGVAASPWRRLENKLDIGAIMKTYHGGGHKDVGATEFKTKAQAEKAFREINKLLER